MMSSESVRGFKAPVIQRYKNKNQIKMFLESFVCIILTVANVNVLHEYPCLCLCMIP